MKTLFAAGEDEDPERAFILADQRLWHKMKQYPDWQVTAISHQTLIRQRIGRIVDLPSFKESPGVQEVIVVTLLACISRKPNNRNQIEGSSA